MAAQIGETSDKPVEKVDEQQPVKESAPTAKEVSKNTPAIDIPPAEAPRPKTKKDDTMGLLKIR
jgi:hypothetical protein